MVLSLLPLTNVLPISFGDASRSGANGDRKNPVGMPGEGFLQLAGAQIPNLDGFVTTATN